PDALPIWRSSHAVATGAGRWRSPTWPRRGTATGSWPATSRWTVWSAAVSVAMSLSFGHTATGSSLSSCARRCVRCRGCALRFGGPDATGPAVADRTLHPGRDHPHLLGAVDRRRGGADAGGAGRRDRGRPDR